MKDSSVPICPRCAYDLSGQATFLAPDADRCPLSGTCSECGLTFAWTDIFNRDRLEVPGFVEHARGLFSLFTTAWRTWSWTILPYRFWNRVRLEHEPRPRRMMAWLLLTAGLLWFIGCSAATVAWVATGSSGDIFQELANLWAWPILQVSEYPRGTLHIHETITHAPPVITVCAAASITLPIMLLLLPDTRKLSKLRTIHVLRAATYSLAWLLPFLLGEATLAVGRAVDVLTNGTLVAFTRFREQWYERLAYAIDESMHENMVPWIALPFAWLLWWWGSAVSRGFRIQRPVVVWIAITVPAILAAVAALTMNQAAWRLFV